MPTFKTAILYFIQFTFYITVEKQLISNFLFFFFKHLAKRQVGMANTHQGTNFITRSSAMTRDGRFVVCMLGLAMTDLCTKYEISTLTHYKDIKGDEKTKKLGGLGG